MPRPSKRTKPKATVKRGPGQPEKEIDLKQLQILCQMQATSAEIAAYFDCSVKTIERHKASKPEFAQAMDNGRLKGLVSLRRAMTDSYADATVIDSDSYSYAATAVDQSGNESGYSNIISIAVPSN